MHCIRWPAQCRALNTKQEPLVSCRGILFGLLNRNDPHDFAMEIQLGQVSYTTLPIQKQKVGTTYNTFKL